MADLAGRRGGRDTSAVGRLAMNPGGRADSPDVADADDAR